MEPKSPAKTQKSDDELFCNECMMPFKSRSKYNRHMREQHPKGKPKLFRCPECPAVFKRKYNLKRHIKAKHLDDKIQCPLCTARFTEPCKLKEHMITVHEVYKCEKCGAIVHNSVKGSHVCRPEYQLSPKMYTCEICGKKYKRLAYLKKHIQVKHIDQGLDKEERARGKRLLGEVPDVEQKLFLTAKRKKTMALRALSSIDHKIEVLETDCNLSEETHSHSDDHSHGGDYEEAEGEHGHHGHGCGDPSHSHSHSHGGDLQSALLGARRAIENDFLQFEIQLEYDVVKKNGSGLGTPVKIMKKDFFSGCMEMPSGLGGFYGKSNNHIFGSVSLNFKPKTN